VQYDRPCRLIGVGLADSPPERFRLLRALVSVLGPLDLPKTLKRSQTITSSFADLGISKPVSEALSKRGIQKPFPVQSAVIGDVLAGHDVLVQSPTGSGKTLAFGAPLVELLDPGTGTTAALVLAPTRELASQIVDELDGIARVCRLRIAAVYGGVGFGPQISAARKADIIVATPGRLEDLLERGVVSLKQVRTLVLDEADRMLDMGFKPAVDRIVAQMPSDRQTLFFSATLEGAAGKLASAYTRKPRRHTQEAEQRRRADIDHRFVHVESQSEKLGHLVEQLRRDGDARTLVFVRTKRGADRLVKRLRVKQIEAVAMHGDKSQGQRERALASFERGDVGTLVATDVAARGIDVPDITNVVNFDAPGDRDAYVHRVGRTGRAGRSGAGLSLVLGEQTKDMRRIANDLGLTREFDGHQGRKAPNGDHSRGSHQGRQGSSGDQSRGGRNRRRRTRGPA
jgi:ATP-dependent RNA helicase RhlE